MIENGTKVSIEISEPWDAYRVFTGTIIRSINSGKYFVIRENESNELYIVACRIKGDQLNDILKGKVVIVGIATPHPSLDILNLSEITEGTFRWLNYVYIGGMKLKV